MQNDKTKETGGLFSLLLAQWRLWFVVAFLCCAGGGLVLRLLQLQVMQKDFLNEQGDARTVRHEEIRAHRGMITDRYGEPLAVSTAVETIWMNPKLYWKKLRAAVDEKPEDYQAIKISTQRLAQVLEVSEQWLMERLQQNETKGFIYLKRKAQPAVAQRVKDLKTPGVFTRREYMRYYPAGEVASHVLGFVNIDEKGQEGVELAYDDWLQGASGKKKVLKDGNDNIIKDLALVKEAEPGKNLKLTVDMRLQYLAYRELKAVVAAHQAKAGSVVMLDAKSGDILAMVNQPSYNPNNRKNIVPSSMRNRAVTDLFEPGSTMKPLTVAAALETGKYSPETSINTAPGFLRIGRKNIRDHRDYGLLDVASIIAKSSNVGTSKIALDITGEALWDMYYRLGFGQMVGIGFPGEGVGVLPHPVKWKPLQVATMSYGYGLNLTALQLAQAYQVLANNGVKSQAALIYRDKIPEGEAVMPSRVAKDVREMLAKVVAKGGTGTRAQVEAYDVGGKTGTVHSVGASGYEDSNYKAIFAGLAPVDNPAVVMVVVVVGPSGDEYYGGEVAAPVFSRVISGAMRLLNVRPDHLPAMADSEKQLEEILGNHRS